MLKFNEEENLAAFILPIAATVLYMRPVTTSELLFIFVICWSLELPILIWRARARWENSVLQNYEWIPEPEAPIEEPENLPANVIPFRKRA